MSLLTIVSLFGLCALVIVISGARLSYYGDVIAERSGLGHAWVGVIAMASVTSLPELVTGVSASVINAPEIAAGDIVGSCLFNLLILGLLDLLSPTSLFARLRPVHTLSAALGALLLLGVAGGILTAGHWPVFGWIGLPSLILFGGYAFAVKSIVNYERTHDQVGDDNVLAEKYAHLSLSGAVWRYVGTAVVLVAAAANLPHLAVGFAEATGLQEGFVGTVFVALSTSLPELVVSLAAVRLGAWDMAAANVLGSNLFNVAILAVDDAFFEGGALLAAVSPTHAVTAVAAAAMSVIVIAGLIARPPRLFSRVSWTMLGLLSVYGLANWFAF
ncbi:MAG: sodium:calcium antiporter [Acidobacteria bacterium]|jgi:cation:H+ antiporter|nr:sodium:calcium antiporter [Acidobacteriota bacterium]